MIFETFRDIKLATSSFLSKSHQALREVAALGRIRSGRLNLLFAQRRCKMNDDLARLSRKNY